jgi:hypothetical protein
VGPIENLKQAIAGETSKLAALVWSRHQLDASIAGLALRTDDAGHSHARKLSFHPNRVIHKLFTGLSNKLTIAKGLGIREVWGAGLELSTRLPAAWTMNVTETALFVIVVLGLAGAGTWVSVIG